MKRLFLLSLLVLGLYAPITTPALATCTVNTVPQVGVICDVSRNPTYTGSSVGLVPAASATDLYCISAGTTKDVTIRRLSIGGTAGTAITTPFLLYMRSALGTAGTAATGLALPVGTALNSSDPTSTAVLTAYTANPTVAATPVLMDALLVDLPVTTASGGDITAVKTWGTSVDLFSKGITIKKNTTSQLCANLNGVSVSSGVLNIIMEWTEN